MSYKELQNTVLAGGYVLSSKYTGLVVEGSASVQGPGVSAGFSAVIETYGAVTDIALTKGGTVKNHATIGGGSNVDITITGASGLVENYGTIAHGVSLAAGGTVKNTGFIGYGIGVDISGKTGLVENYGAIHSTVDLKSGGTVKNDNEIDTNNGPAALYVAGAAGTVSNLGTITDTGGPANAGQSGPAGVALGDGGAVTNGTLINRFALIQGYSGVVVRSKAGTISNFGIILGDGLPPGTAPTTGTYVTAAGVVLYDGGGVTNGALTDHAAQILGGYEGVYSQTAATVTNFGTIEGVEAIANDGSNGVSIKGGLITNGALTDHAAEILGYTAVNLNGAGTVVNFGTIQGEGAARAAGIVFGKTSGAIVNGALTDTHALIAGAYGAYLADGGSVTNLGTISGWSEATGSAGLVMAAGGYVANGSSTDADARIDGYNGLLAKGSTTIANYGSIVGAGGAGTYGISLGAGGLVTNGAAGSGGGKALIQGTIGLAASGAATVINYGAIKGRGAGAVAVQFGSSADRLIVEAGSVLGGAANGGGGTVEFAGGAGTIASASGGFMVSASGSSSFFSNFDTIELDAPASFTAMAGAGQPGLSIAAGDSIVVNGSLTFAGSPTPGPTLANAGLIESLGTGTVTINGSIANTGTLEASGGTLTANGAVTGAGKVIIGAGLADFTSTFSEAVTFAAGSTGELELTQAYSGSIAGFSTTGATRLDLADIAFTPGVTTATFSGTTKGGTLTVTTGSEVVKIKLTGDYVGSTFTPSTDGHGGTLIVDPPKAAASTPSRPVAPASPQVFIEASASIGATTGSFAEPAVERKPAAIPFLAPPLSHSSGAIL